MAGVEVVAAIEAAGAVEARTAVGAVEARTAAGAVEARTAVGAVEARTAAGAPRLTAGTNLFANSRARADLPARALSVWRRL